MTPSRSALALLPEASKASPEETIIESGVNWSECVSICSSWKRWFATPLLQLRKVMLARMCDCPVS